VTHARAKLTVQGRVLLVTRVLEQGWTVPMAAEAQGCSSATGYKWIRRFLAEGREGLADRSSRPHHCPMRLSSARERAILRRRERTLEGPHRIGWALGEAPSTVHGCSADSEPPGSAISTARPARSCATNGIGPASSCTST
jgi:transposase-like protein